MKIISSVVNTSFSYENSDLVVSGNFQLNPDTKTLQSINGTCNRPGTTPGTQGAFVCNFNGFLNDDKMQYTFSQMSLEDAGIVATAIEEIVEWIGENA